VPHLATCIFLFFYNEPELGVGINPGMALTPLPSSIGQGLNPLPSDREPSALPLDHSFRLSNTRKLFEISIENKWRHLTSITLAILSRPGFPFSIAWQTTEIQVRTETDWDILWQIVTDCDTWQSYSIKKTISKRR
jgi:hypothetical protein